MKYFVRVNGEEFEIELNAAGQLTLNGEPVDADLVRIPNQNLYSLLLNHHSYELAVEETRTGYRILLGGEQYEVDVTDERQRRLMAGRSQPAPPSGEAQITAPIPGLIVKVEVKEGDHVTAGQPVVILEAMKMENEIRAPREGEIRAVHVAPGQSVEQGAVLITLG